MLANTSTLYHLLDTAAIVPETGRGFFEVSLVVILIDLSVVSLLPSRIEGPRASRNVAYRTREAKALYAQIKTRVKAMVPSHDPRNRSETFVGGLARGVVPCVCGCLVDVLFFSRRLSRFASDVFHICCYL